MRINQYPNFKFCILSVTAIIFIIYTSACAVPGQQINNSSVAPPLTASATPQDEKLVRETEAAIAQKNYDRLRELLNAKQNLNVRDQNSDSLLATAMLHDIKSFAMLLEAGADPNFTSNVIGCGATERCLKPLLYIAFEAKNLPAMALLLKYKADPNAESVLASAVSHGDKEAVTLLLSYKADANFSAAVGEAGQTPIFFADKPELAEILLKHGADINHRDQTGTTPLMLVLQENNLSMALFFVKHGADVNAKNGKGLSVLQIAMATGNKKIINELKKAGAS